MQILITVHFIIFVVRKKLKTHRNNQRTIYTWQTNRNSSYLVQCKVVLYITKSCTTQRVKYLIIIELDSSNNPPFPKEKFHHFQRKNPPFPRKKIHKFRNKSTNSGRKSISYKKNTAACLIDKLIYTDA